MKRTIKNIIIILIIIAVGVLTFFTMKNIANRNSNNFMRQMNNDENRMQEPQKMQNNNETSETSSINMTEPPAKPDGEETNEQNGTMTEPPEKPDEESNDEQNLTVTEPNLMASNNDEGQQMNMPEMPNINNQIELTVKDYIVFSVEGFVEIAFILYLILSQFNKKSFKETFKGGNKIAIMIFATIIFTAGLVFAFYEITLNCFNVENNQPMDMQGPDGMPGSGNLQQSNSNITYSGATEITESTELSGKSYESTTKDENAVLVSGDINVTLADVTVEKTGDSEGGDSSSFYGNNSGIIAKDGAKLTLKNIKVTTNASGANGVFSYGGSATTNNASSDGTTITISNSEITTTGDNAGGIMTTGGGTTIASNLTINTAGTSSAAIRSDRGGGTVNVDGGTYTTTGIGSPSIYSTANISVENAKLVAKASEGIVIEGKNSVSIDNCELIDSNTKLNGQSTTYKNIFLYQSMSGDAANGNAEFTAKDSTITTNNGDTLYVTNTTASIELENNEIINNDKDGNFLRVQKDSWGNSGSNGGNVTLVLKNQKITGNIVIDSISTLDMTMKNGSYFEGTINADKSAKSIKLTLDSNSKIKLTADSYVTSLEDEDTTYSNIDFNGYKLYVNGVAIN